MSERTYKEIAEEAKDRKQGTTGKTFKESDAERQKKEREERCRKSVEDKRQLSFFPDFCFEAPAVILRSSIFGVVKKSKYKKYFENEKLASWSGTEVFYTGIRLTQADLDVYLTLIELQKWGVVGSVISTTETRLLKSMGRRAGGKDIVWIRKCIARLIASCIDISTAERSYLGSLIVAANRDNTTGEISFVLDPMLADFFGEGGGVWQSKEHRAKVKGELAKWLLGYVNSHKATVKAPHSINIESLKALCGSDAELKMFKVRLKQALVELERVEAITHWGIASNGVLRFVRPERKPVLPEPNATEPTNSSEAIEATKVTG